jgi:hypothetical protein
VPARAAIAEGRPLLWRESSELGYAPAGRHLANILRYPWISSGAINPRTSSVSKTMFLDVDDLAPDGKLNQIAVRAQLEFPHDVCAMHVHRLYTDIQRSGYFFIAPPQRQ